VDFPSVTVFYQKCISVKDVAIEHNFAIRSISDIMLACVIRFKHFWRMLLRHEDIYYTGIQICVSISAISQESIAQKVLLQLLAILFETSIGIGIFKSTFKKVSLTTLVATEITS